MLGNDWSREEVEATVADYFAMLELHIGGVAFNKSEHRRHLAKLLDHRSESSIEFKHQNISAVLIELGVPYISGYLPRYNYQNLLGEVVAERLEGNKRLISLIAEDVDRPITVAPIDDILDALVDAPERRAKVVHERTARPYDVPDSHFPINYLERESRNRALGEAGEEFVLRYETARLISERCERLAAKIEHVSKSRGDGAGFDILSFESTGAERFIEVKATKYGKETPFFVSRNELLISQHCAEKYHIYRAFDLRAAVGLYTLPGAISTTCDLNPTTYRASAK